MAYSTFRVSLRFDEIQRMAGALKIRAEATEDELERAFLQGGAEALFLLAPNVSEPTADNIVTMMMGTVD